MFTYKQAIFDDYNPQYDRNIEDIFKEVDKNREDDDYELCDWCNGSGEMYDGSERKCYKCNGLGVLFNHV